ncbi:MarR family winged helix-turn-helix transcriptional regulator [Saccharomonospora xinjiangensis]|uniref:Transcriptional regulator n=1 Tax=Saccharomonospora xinjiangensis XJ-54 TaxID=882086 RepID=I0V1W7_9PSEU|nr:MarR family transcriptional regulator [Saccharomonospora xinjiangensis]EID54120.1 transcriptional regulator [Saccharomonospora xinjiangensis XJ-54]
MSDESGEVRWLTDAEMLVWRSYIVSTLMLRQRLHRELAERQDVSLIDYEVLVCLSAAEGGAMRMSELATMLGSTKSRLSHQVARMEAAGYVKRVPLAGDRRGVAAELTEQGAALLRRSAPIHVEGVRAHFVDLLTEQEQQIMGRAFSRILTHLSELAD